MMINLPALKFHICLPSDTSNLRASDDDAFSFYSMSIKLTASIFFYLKSNSENHKDFILLGFC